MSIQGPKNNSHFSRENITAKKIVVTKSNQLAEFVRTTGLIRDLEIRGHFGDEVAQLEVCIYSPNAELLIVESSLHVIRKELRSRFMQHQKNYENFLIAANDDNQEQPSTKLETGSNITEFEAYMKLLNRMDGMQVELDFFEVGKEVIEIRLGKTDSQKIIDGSVVEIIAGSILQFCEKTQKVTLYDLDSQSGHFTLEVDDPAQREKLINSQRDNERVTLAYSPTIDPLFPDEKIREGRLKFIVSAEPNHYGLLF